MTTWNDIITSPDLAARYTATASQFNWPAFGQHAYFAYWYARFVVGDRWPEGEPIINQDQTVAKHYRSYLGVLGGLVGWSTREDSLFNIDSNGRILGWKPGKKPLESQPTPKLKRRRKLDVDAIAAKVEAHMAEIKRQKKLKEANAD